MAPPNLPGGMNWLDELGVSGSTRWGGWPLGAVSGSGMAGSDALWWVKRWETGGRALTAARARGQKLFARQSGEKELAGLRWPPGPKWCNVIHPVKGSGLVVRQQGLVSFLGFLTSVCDLPPLGASLEGFL